MPPTHDCPNIVDLLRSRPAVRRFATKPVERHLLQALLEAAMAAPSACASEPWEFVVVTAPETLDELQISGLAGRHHSPAAIVVCANVGHASHAAASRYWLQDCTAAIENMLVAATGLGLGVAWIGLYPLDGPQADMRQLLEIPTEVIPLALLCVGHPAEAHPAPDRYDPRRIHWQRYEPGRRSLKARLGF